MKKCPMRQEQAEAFVRYRRSDYVQGNGFLPNRLSQRRLQEGGGSKIQVAVKRQGRVESGETKKKAEPKKSDGVPRSNRAAIDHASRSFSPAFGLAPQRLVGDRHPGKALSRDRIGGQRDPPDASSSRRRRAARRASCGDGPVSRRPRAAGRVTSRAISFAGREATISPPLSAATPSMAGLLRAAIKSSLWESKHTSVCCKPSST